jgi:type I restriction enzyme R subunit
MGNIGKTERISQNRVVKLFTETLGYRYLGNWEEELTSSPIDDSELKRILVKRGYSGPLAQKAVDKLISTSNNLSNGLYETNKKVYSLLRYGADVRVDLGDQKEKVWFIDWKNPENNEFAIAEEVTVVGKNTKRPDIVVYINGIAVGVIELKRSKVSLEEGIRQNLDNQKPEFIEKFFTTTQFIVAGNDTQGARYGTIETKEKYYLKWKEKTDLPFDYILDKHIFQMFRKERFLELIRDFVVFDKGVKKLCRPNQYFGIKAAQENVLARKGGILWHTQGSGKSLTMVWLTKWIKENVKDSRVLIITDREELDDQIEKLYTGVDENIYRTKDGNDLIRVLNEKTEMLICSLVHKFGRHKDEGDYDSFIEEVKKSMGSDFRAKGNIHVFVDECHRTQSGKLHDAMKLILPDALFIGFTGTPLLKKDKEKSIEVFGPYIGSPYKFDEAVEDGVVLDLLYEARDIEQYITDQKSVDEWFEAETKGLTDVAKVELKRRWGTMRKVMGSKSRLEKIVFDIIKDFKVKPRLCDGQGNAMLVSSSVYNACKYYELFLSHGFKDCAIVTSYEPNTGDIKGEETGEDTPTEKLLKYHVYKDMLQGKSTEQFEQEVTEKFKNEPGKMKLLIVVDKLLTGFDAPSATYLYIDKKMQDHGLFQAICRVNRVDTESKDYGYIIDYKDLFSSLKRSIQDYTSAAFDQYDSDDVMGLLKNRLTESKDRLETALEAVIALCENVFPKNEPEYIKYFCGNTENPQDIKDTEERRVALYKAVVSLIRAYANVANEMSKLGYTEQEAEDIKEQVQYYSDLRETIKQASGDYIDFKRFEPGMRQLMDMYLSADASRKISDFENKSLVDLIIKLDEDVQDTEKGKRKTRQEAVAETIENNVRKVINEEAQTNPKYFEKMSKLLDEIIDQRKNEALEYEKYLQKIKELAERVAQPSKGTSYPMSINSRAKQALYDNLDGNEELSVAVDHAVRYTKLDDWKDGGIKEKMVRIAVGKLVEDPLKVVELMEIIKAQDEY